MKYQDIIDQKNRTAQHCGFDTTVDELKIHYPGLFDYQLAILRWCVKKGRSAVFADTGLGKTFLQLAWADFIASHSGNRVLIVCPLSVASQTQAEAVKFGIGGVRKVLTPDRDVRIQVTNYARLDAFENDIANGYFSGIVLDESSILKHEDSKTRAKILSLASNMEYRLSCTATPAPNDTMELAGQCDFVGPISGKEMLSSFFTHDSGETSKWRLKHHAEERFWAWLATWAIVVRNPKQLSFADGPTEMPPLHIEEINIDGECVVSVGIVDRIKNKRASESSRVEAAAKCANSTSEQMIIWCSLNTESKALAKIVNGSIEVVGSDSDEKKESAFRRFETGEVRCLITKPSIAGFGMNWQHCRNVLFVGLNDSYEQLYQAIRRCWRYGQTRSVDVFLVCAPEEGPVRKNLLEKEARHELMHESMATYMRDAIRLELGSASVSNKKLIKAREKSGAGWTIHQDDCVNVLSRMPDNSVDYSIYSPPFSSLYVYSDSDYDMGNNSDDETFFQQYRFLIREHFRTHKPGRNISVHCMNLPSSKTHHGFIGIRDFRGRIIKEFQDAGFIYHSEVTIWKDPVVAMQRTKALGLLWKQIKKNSAMSRQGIPDYLVTFRKPGDASEPITHTPEEFPVSEWQKYASPCWVDIVQSNTLNKKQARDQRDERHIAPLQLQVIERGIALWSNPGDIVLSPFAGIGSEGYVALKMGRKFIGAELKPSYFSEMIRYLTDAEKSPPMVGLPKIKSWKLNDDSGEPPGSAWTPSISGQMDLFQGPALP